MRVSNVGPEQITSNAATGRPIPRPRLWPASVDLAEEDDGGPQFKGPTQFGVVAFGGPCNVVVVEQSAVNMTVVIRSAGGADDAQAATRSRGFQIPVLVSMTRRGSRWQGRAWTARRAKSLHHWPGLAPLRPP